MLWAAPRQRLSPPHSLWKGSLPRIRAVRARLLHERSTNRRPSVLHAEADVGRLAARGLSAPRSGKLGAAGVAKAASVEVAGVADVVAEVVGGSVVGGVVDGIFDGVVDGGLDWSVARAGSAGVVGRVVPRA